MVMLMVSLGLLFSGIQFGIALRSAKHRTLSQPTTLKASAEGFEITTSVLGIVILAISLAFFYLYLVHVFPIVVIPR